MNITILKFVNSAYISLKKKEKYEIANVTKLISGQLIKKQTSKAVYCYNGQTINK